MDQKGIMSLRILLWQEGHPTVHGGAESWLKDTAQGLRLLGHSVSWLQNDQIKQAVDQFRPDAVILGTIHNFIGLNQASYLSKNRIPTVWMLHDYWPFCRPRMLMQDHNQSDKGCEAVDGICKDSCKDENIAQGVIAAFVNQFYTVTGCECAAQIMRRNGIRVRAVVEEGIDTDLFKPGTKFRATEGGVPRPGGSLCSNEIIPVDSKVVYASAAGEEVWKGIHILREAVEGTDLQSTFLTGLSRQELAETLSHATIYAFPSVYQEIWGLALTEAMACGCAVVASDVAGARAQIHEGMGMLVPAGDPRALREALLFLADNPRLASEMARRAQIHVRQEHGLKAIGKRWERVIEGVKACAV